MEFVHQTRILAVDDDEGSRKLMKAMLAPLGCQVVTVSSGIEAVDMVSSQKWDVVLMDISMPDMDGLTALEIIREKYPMEDLPVVMVTGRDDSESRLRALQLRASDFIIKPIEQAELTARLGTILTMRRAKRELEERLKEAEAGHDSAMKMMGSVVHEIKGSLTVAQGFIELVLAESEASGTALPGSNLGRALAAVVRAEGLAEEVNDVTAMGRGKLVPRMEDVDLQSLLKKWISDFRWTVSKSDISVGLRCLVDAPMARADKVLLERVVDKLVLGGIRRIGAKGEIVIGVDPSGEDYLLVSVKDTGRGAPQPFRQRIFNQECQEELHKLGFDSYTGIGMSFSRMAVEVMGGKMWVNSTPNEGTVFSFILPLAIRRAFVQATLKA